MPGKKLYLIDGANYVYRAYYAIRNLSNSKGLPTGAIYGFVQMLLKLIRDENPDLVAVCFDTAEPTFRDEMYEEYKANRKEPPDDLVQQFPYVRPAVDVLGLPVLEKPGFEADDIIGTVAKRFAKKGYDIVVVSGDKDLMQLVGPHIMMLDEMKGLRIGPKEVEDKFGVGPDKVVEVLGLAGDSSDNVPGINGVGPKTAETLIQKYGSVENVIAHASELKGALAEKVKKHAEDARLSLKLVTIDTNVDISVNENDLVRREIDDGKMRELFGELGFSSLISELTPKTAIEKVDYALISNEGGLKKIVEKIGKAGELAIHVIASSPDPLRAEILGVALSCGEGQAAYMPIGHGSTTKTGETADLFGGAKLHGGQIELGKVFKTLSIALENKSIKKYGHNLNFTLAILKNAGIVVAGVECDAMLAAYVLNPGARNEIERLSEEYLGHTMIDEEGVLGKGRDKISISEAAPEKILNFACERADVSFRLSKILCEKVKAAGLSLLLSEMEMPLLEVLVEMELAGIKVDCAKLKNLEIEFSGRIRELEAKIYKLAGETFNVNSPKQLGEILFGKLKLEGAKKTKTGFSTSQDILEELASTHELPRLVLDYRSLSKLKGTYIDALPELIDPKTNRIHTSFNQAVTATGRLSSSDPNMQNIPVRGEEGKRIREAFVAEDGFVLLSADYSQIELRVLAHMSRDDTLVCAFKEGLDVHSITASGIFGVPVSKVTKEQRAVGKTVNFATIYGQTPYGLSKQLGIDVGDAAEYIENYFKKYPRVAKYRDEVIARAKNEGKVKTLFGRVRFVPDITSSNAQMAQITERVAFNTVFQGTAADIIKRAMIEIHDELQKISARSRMILQVHDELLFEIPKGDSEPVKKFVTDKMQTAAKLDVPLIVDVGIAKNWSDAH